jgi:DNA polymerase-3 subunit epsilon
VENGNYRGFGFFSPEHTANNIDLIKDCVKPYSNNRDIQTIIRGYLRQEKAEMIIKL